MKTVIVYASVHHGNTKKLVEKIADMLVFGGIRHP